MSFNLNALRKVGLPDPLAGTAKWFCGDYVMAAIEPVLQDNEFAIVVENDAVPMLQDIAE